MDSSRLRGPSPWSSQTDVDLPRKKRTPRVTLDSTYQQYEQVVIGTILTTLNAGSAVLTIFPNFNVQLKDPTLSNRFKVQVQLVGAPQEETALSATLHHQIIYRIQDHCFDLPGEKEFAGNALMVLAAEDQEIPTIIQVPRQIPREELRQLIPTEWISNYENFKKKEKPLISTEATFRRNSIDGSVKTTFKWRNKDSSGTPPVFHTMMITLGDKERKIPVHSFQQNGKAIFSDKLNGHFLWDVDLSVCDPDCNCSSDNDSDSDSSDDEDDLKKKRWCKPPPKPSRKDDPENRPWIGIRKKTTPLPIYREGIKTLRKEG